MHRVLIPPDQAQGSSVTISDPDTLHHLLRVLRVKPGERLECFDGQGRRYDGAILRCSRREVVIAGAWRADEAKPPVRVTLIQALIKPERFDWVVEKATELGVSQIVPMTTARTAVRRPPDPSARRLERWQRIAEAAATQCGRATVPTIAAPQPFDRVAGSLKSDCALVFTLTGSPAPLASALRHLESAAEAAVMIGPEGDFTSEEVALACRAGAHPVRFQRPILRSETAAVAALAILQQTVGVL